MRSQRTTVAVAATFVLALGTLTGCGAVNDVRNAVDEVRDAVDDIQELSNTEVSEEWCSRVTSLEDGLAAQEWAAEVKDGAPDIIQDDIDVIADYAEKHPDGASVSSIKDVSVVTAAAKVEIAVGLCLTQHPTTDPTTDPTADPEVSQPSGTSTPQQDSGDQDSGDDS
ncbi:MAG: hypothetical protein FWH11_06970 [Micrococcales bacterium]|nr:hypothetical protein [Micrococcales bacterium]